MRYAIGTIRLGLAVLFVAAVVGAYIGEVDHGGGALPNPFNFFGLFTIQNNLLAAFGLLLAGFSVVSGSREPCWLPGFRGAVVAYLAVVGSVYWTLLAPTQQPGDILVPWANTVMHTVAPLAVALDWLLFADRPALKWSRIWVVLPYPVVWLTVVLIRGATDGWVPYPFLEPANGAGSIAVVCVGICVVLLVVQAVVTALSYLRVVCPGSLVSVQGAHSAEPVREGASA